MIGREGFGMRISESFGRVTSALVLALAATASFGNRQGQAPQSNLASSVEELARIKPGPELDKSIAALAGQGDRAVEEIGRQLAAETPDFLLVHASVRVLKEVNSAKSRALLRRLALGEMTDGNGNLEAWAASRLLSCDTQEAANLLSAPSAQVLLVALNSMAEQQLDGKNLPRVKKCLENRDPLVCRRAAAVLAKAPGGQPAKEAVEALGQALAKVGGLAGANDLDERQYRFAGYLTLGESHYWSFASALADAHIDNRSLHELAGRQEGRARDAVYLALARRGDTTVHDQMVRLAQDSRAGLFRAWAARSLGDIGSKADVALLEKIATTDPLERKGPLGPPNPIDSVGPTFPVRAAARDAIRAIENRQRARQAGAGKAS